MSNKPVVLVINYNENNQPPDETKLNEILSSIEENNPDIFILTTQDSMSGTDSHIHHSVKEKIENSKKRKYLRRNTKIEESLKKYKLFSKVDGTRLSNSKFGFFNTEKPYNVRTRIWINTETVEYTGLKNFSKNSYSNKVKKNPTLNKNSNSNSDTSKTNSIPDKINIKKYSYRRITDSDDNGRKGIGSIMTSISLEKNSKYYGYIIFNTNPKLSYTTKNNNLILANNINYKKGFITPNNRGFIYNVSMPTMKLKGEIIVLCVSKSQKYLLKKTNIGKNKNIYNFIKNIKNRSKAQLTFTNNTPINNKNIIFTQITNKNNLNDKYTIVPNENSSVSGRSSLVSFESIVTEKNSELNNNPNVTLELSSTENNLQGKYITVPNENSSVSKFNLTMSTIKKNFGILKKNIQTILINCHRPITKESINTYINEYNTSLKKSNVHQKFTFDSILKDLEHMKNYIENNNLKNIYKNVYDSINKYLNIWEKINNTLIFFKDKRENTRNNQIENFLVTEIKGYTLSQIKFHRLPYSNDGNDGRF